MKHSIFVFLLFCASCGALGDSKDELSGGYYLIQEGAQDIVIIRDIYADGDKYIPCAVVAHTFDKNFIIAKQVKVDDCFAGHDRYIYPEGDEFYWIIDHKNNLFLGPLIKSDYLKQRAELKIPEKLQL